jgi:hypothetical protein
MAFTAQITASFFLAAAVMAAPMDSVSVGASSVHFNRNSNGASWQSGADYYDDNDNDVYRREGDAYDSRLVRRGAAADVAAAPLTRRSRSDSFVSVASSSSDSDYARHTHSRPAFSRELPSKAQMNYEAEKERHSAPYGRRLMRRSFDDYSDADSDSDSYGQDYRQSLRRRPSHDNDYYGRLQRRGESRRAAAYGDDDDSASDSSDSGYGRSVGSSRNTPYADDYYEGVAGSRPYGRTVDRDYRLVRRAPRHDRRPDGDSDTSETDTSSESSSENHDTEDEDSEKDDYGSDKEKDSDKEDDSDHGDYSADEDDHDSDNDYKSENDNKSDADYNAGSAQDYQNDNQSRDYQ